MSILIKNMAMPKNCGECPFTTPTRDGLTCNAVSFLAKCLAHPISRMSCCPLVEAPPHGKWVLKTFCDEYGEYQLYECNLCGAVTAQRKSKNYCHSCGAKMESEE